MEEIVLEPTYEGSNEFEVEDFTGDDTQDFQIQESIDDPVYEQQIYYEPEEVIYIPEEIPIETTESNQIEENQIAQFEVIESQDNKVVDIPAIVETTTESTSSETPLYDSDILNKISDQLQVLVEASNETTEETEPEIEEKNIITLEETTTEITTEFSIDDIYRSLSDINENIVYIGQQNERTEETITNFFTGVLGVLLVGLGAFAAYAAFSKIYG